MEGSYRGIWLAEHQLTTLRWCNLGVIIENRWWCMLVSGVRLRFMLQLCNTILARLLVGHWKELKRGWLSENLWLQKNGTSGVGGVVEKLPHELHMNLWRDINSHGIIFWSSFDHDLCWRAMAFRTLCRADLGWTQLTLDGFGCCTLLYNFGDFTSYFLCFYLVHLKCWSKGSQWCPVATSSGAPATP